MKENKKVIVIGGVAGGMSFATRYRRLNQNDKIIIFEKGPYVSFANCGLPYYLSGEIKSRARLLVVKEEELVKRFNLDIRSNSEVISIDSKGKSIKYINNGVEKTESYDKLVISTGAKPIVPSIKGLETIPSFQLRNIPNLDELYAHLKDTKPEHATVVGGGFIGLEVAESISKLGIKVALIEKAKEVLPPFDYEMAAFAHDELVKNNVDVYNDNEIIDISNNIVTLNSGDTFRTDFVLTSIGVLPDTKIVLDANIETGFKNGIKVNEYFETSIKDIYAIGDAIIVKNQVSKADSLIPLASPANRQGRQLADILSQMDVSYKGTLGTSIVRIFNLTFAQTGLNERTLQGKEYKVIHLLANNHASYFPGATQINLKVIFNPVTEEIYGAQALGENGVDKRIDVIATAIKAKMKVTELQELELTYAPPYGSAKDIVNLAGYVSQNVIKGISKTYQWHEVDDLLANNVLFLDVRSQMERMAYGHIENSINIPIDELYERINEIPKNRKIVTYCESGTRSYNAEVILHEKGFDVHNLDGSYAIYSKGKRYIKNV